MNSQDSDVRKIHGDKVRSFIGNKRHTISMTSRGLEIHDNKDVLVVTIAPSNVKSAIKFSDAFSTYNTVFHGAANKIKLLLSDEDLATLKAWIDKVTSQELSDMEFDKIKEYESIEIAMRKEIRRWGAALIIMGLLQIKLAQYLDPIWGGVLILAGIVNTFVSKAQIFVFNGFIILSAAVMNLVVGSSSGSIGWVVYGFVQLAWGANEIRKFFKYKKVMSVFEKARNG